MAAPTTRFSLRFKDRQITLPVGGFVIGRGSTCDLVIDSPAVSRIHAMLTASDSLLWLEDGGSVNGVFVNDVRLAAARSVCHGDRIGIGGYQILVVDANRRRREAPTQPTPTFGKETLDVASFDDPTLQVSRKSAEATLRTAREALVENQVPRAERAALSLLETIIATPTAELDAVLTREAIQMALDLARSTSKAAWLGPVFRAYGATRQIPEPATMLALEQIVKTLGIGDLSTYRAYVGRLRGMASTLTPSERDVVARLERLAPLQPR